MILAAILVFALTRAEIVQRMRAPVVTQSDGLVRVFADCGEDVRREFQSPVARFAADTVEIISRNLKEKPKKFTSPHIVIHIGDARTNDLSVVTKVTTNEIGVVTRLRLANPATADIGRFRLEVIKAFSRSVLAKEIGDAEATADFRRAVPELRIADERQRLEDWRAGKGGLDDEEALRMMRKVIEPGFASKREVLTFAARLYLYPAYYAGAFLGRYHQLSFREAARMVDEDPRIRFAAFAKADELVVMGGGRGEKLSAAAERYSEFLRELARLEKPRGEIMDILEDAEAKLYLALEGAK